jgi:MFS transporter, FHS family, Na+ dependent glucose transporter 1
MTGDCHSQKPPFSLHCTRRLTAGYFIAFASLGMARSFLGPSLLEFSHNTSVQLGEISFLFVVLGLGNLAGNWLGGWLLDRLPGNPIILTVIVSNGLLLALAPALKTLSLLAAVILVLGFGYGVLETGGNTMTMWLHRSKAGPYLSGLYLFTGIGALVAPALIGLSLEHLGTIHPAFIALGLIALPVVLVLLRLPSPLSQSQETNQAGGPIDYLLVGFVCLLYFLCVGSQASFSGWIYTYAVQLNLATELQAAYLTSAYWMAQTVGLLLSILLLMHVRPQKVLVGVLTTGLLSLVFLLTWPNALSTWIGTIGLGLGMAPLFPAAFAFVGKRMTISGQMNGWFLSGASVGAMSIPWVAGQIVAANGPRSGMLLVAGLFTLAFLLLLGYLLRARTT